MRVSDDAKSAQRHSGDGEMQVKGPLSDESSSEGEDAEQLQTCRHSKVI